MNSYLSGIHSFQCNFSHSDSKLKVSTKAFPVIVKLRVGSFPALVSSLS